MIAASSVVKTTAKAALKGNFLKAMAYCLVFIFSLLSLYTVLSLISTFLPAVAATGIIIVLILLLAVPLNLGVIRAFWRIMWNVQDDGIGVVFYYFSSRKVYERALKLIAGLSFKMLWIGFLLFLPSIFTDLFSSVKTYDFFGISAPPFATNLWVISAFLKAAAFVILFAVMFKYYLAPFLFIADEEMDAAEAIHKSTLLSRGSAVDFLLLLFSFIGWILISVTVLPLIFTLPYFTMSYIVHSRFSVANYNKVAGRFNNGEDGFQFSADNIEI